MPIEYADSSSRPFNAVERSLAHAPDHIRRAINRNRVRSGLQPYRRMVVEAAPQPAVDSYVRADAVAALARLKQAMAGR